jgi:hypothetical protein
MDHPLYLLIVARIVVAIRYGGGYKGSSLAEYIGRQWLRDATALPP